MPTLTIEDIPKDLLEKLRRTAAEHGRSLNGEVIALLERSAAAGRFDPEAALSRIKRLHERLGPIPPLTDEVAGAGDQRGPPVTRWMEFRFEENGVDQEKPLIYRWEIFDYPGGTRLACYVGKSKNGSRRPRRDYKRNVNRLLAWLPYRRGKPDQFRAIHRLMAEAVRQEQVLVLTLLQNVLPEENINHVEQALRRMHEAM